MYDIGKHRAIPKRTDDDGWQRLLEFIQWLKHWRRRGRGRLPGRADTHGTVGRRSRVKKRKFNRAAEVAAVRSAYAE